MELCASSFALSLSLSLCRSPFPMQIVQRHVSTAGEREAVPAHIVDYAGIRCAQLFPTLTGTCWCTHARV